MTEGILITKPISETAGGIAVYVTGLILLKRTISRSLKCVYFIGNYSSTLCVIYCYNNAEMKS